NPVVIVSDPTLNGPDPVAIRLQKVTGNTFQIRLQEPNYENGTHTSEAVSYVVMNAGDWTLADGTRISVGTRNSNRLTSKGFDSIGLKGFGATPTVLSQVQTANGSDWVTTRTKGQSAKGFQVAMQEEEALNQGSHVQETIGWLAIEQGVASDDDTLLEGGTTDQEYGSDRAQVSFESEFASTPSVIAKLSSFKGSDTANLRLDNISRQSFGVGVYEEQSLDTELSHVNESVAFLALEGESGSLTGLAA
ncbi:MAG: calcium-binding protein, partial [Cyanobacteria bacterium J06559_3]